MMRCPTCEGAGFTADPEDDCPTCEGWGEVEDIFEDGFDGFSIDDMDADFDDEDEF